MKYKIRYLWFALAYSTNRTVLHDCTRLAPVLPSQTHCGWDGRKIRALGDYGSRLQRRWIFVLAVWCDWDYGLIVVALTLATALIWYTRFDDKHVRIRTDAHPATLNCTLLLLCCWLVTTLFTLLNSTILCVLLVYFYSRFDSASSADSHLAARCPLPLPPIMSQNLSTK